MNNLHPRLLHDLLPKQQYFFDCNYGYDQVACHKAALECREKYNLRKAMNHAPGTDSSRGIRYPSKDVW
jgi:hypothetical protein